MWWKTVSAFAFLLIFFAESAFANEAERADEPAVVRRLDTRQIFDGGERSSNVRAAVCEGSQRDNPRVFPDAMALAELVKDKEIRDKIAEQVDFRREQLILIAWTGGSNNKPHRVDVSDDGDSVVFVQPPITFQFSKGDRQHVHFYALPKTAKWSHRKELTRK